MASIEVDLLVNSLCLCQHVGCVLDTMVTSQGLRVKQLHPSPSVVKHLVDWDNFGRITNDLQNKIKVLKFTFSQKLFKFILNV